MASRMTIISKTFLEWQFVHNSQTDQEFDVELEGIEMMWEYKHIFVASRVDALIDSVISISSFQPNAEYTFIGDQWS